METLLDAEGNLFDLAGLDAVVNNCTDAEYEAMNRDYVATLESLADGNADQAREFALNMVESFLEIEQRMRQERMQKAA